jgi:hypothetical protein
VGEDDRFSDAPVFSEFFGTIGAVGILAKGCVPISEKVALVSSNEFALDRARPRSFATSSSDASDTVGCIRAIIDCVRDRVRDRECDLPTDGDSGPFILLKYADVADGGIDAMGRSASDLVGVIAFSRGSDCFSR